MKMTKEEYKKYTQEKSPNSTIFKNCIMAFIVGGAICTFAQLITYFLQKMGLDKESCATVTSITMVFLGAFLTGINVYDKIAKFAGAGTIVPITGFANSIVSPAMEAKSEGYVLGIGAKMFSIAGPVLVYGIVSSVIVGLIMFVFGFNII